MYLMLVLFWIILNGRITLEIVILGMVFALAIYGFAYKFMGLTLQKEKNFCKHFWWMLVYICLLVKEIAAANLQVLKIIFTPGRKTRPVLVSFPSPLKNKFLQVVLADSITLTPGTITVKLNEEGYVVHCLDESMAHGLDQSVFVQQLRKWEE